MILLNFKTKITNIQEETVATCHLNERTLVFQIVSNSHTTHLVALPYYLSCLLDGATSIKSQFTRDGRPVSLPYIYIYYRIFLVLVFADIIYHTKTHAQGNMYCKTSFVLSTYDNEIKSIVFFYQKTEMFFIVPI